MTATGHAGPRDGQTNVNTIVVTANRHSESASAPDGPGSGQKTATRTAETAHGKKGSVTSHGESTSVHETVNDPWSESATREIGHKTPRDHERVQRCPPQESRPREGDECEEHERERSPVDFPIPRECDRRSHPAETEEATGEGSASTRDSCERDDPATPTPVREGRSSRITCARRSRAPPLNGGRGERRPHKNPRGDTLHLPQTAMPPLKEGGGRGGGAGRPVSEDAEAEGRRVGGAEGRVEPEGHFLRRSL